MSDPIGFLEALNVVQAGWKHWAVKKHNAKWVKRLDGTPIYNDLCVHIAIELAAAGSIAIRKAKGGGDA